MNPLLVRYWSRGVELGQIMLELSTLIPPVAVGEPGPLVVMVMRLASSNRLRVTLRTSLMRRLSPPAGALALRSLRLWMRAGEVGEKCASQKSTWYLLVMVTAPTRVSLV